MKIYLVAAGFSLRMKVGDRLGTQAKAAATMKHIDFLLSTLIFVIVSV